LPRVDENASGQYVANRVVIEYHHGNSLPLKLRYLRDRVGSVVKEHNEFAIRLYNVAYNSVVDPIPIVEAIRDPEAVIGFGIGESTDKLRDGCGAVNVVIPNDTDSLASVDSGKDRLNSGIEVFKA